MADPRSVLTRPADGPDLVLRWADHEDGVADVWLPPSPLSGLSGPAPLLFAVHGGFWKQRYDRRVMRPLSQALCALGWAVVAPEYARVGGRRAALAEGVVGGAAWSLVAEDLRAVRHRVPELLAEAAPGRVDADRPVLVGHSAGGQLVLWWALDAAPANRPRHVLALAPVADLVRAHADGLEDGAVSRLLGGSPQAVPESVAADPAARLRSGEVPDGCRLVIVHGESDLQVPAAHTAALAVDVPALDVRLLPGVEHFALIDPLSAAWPTVRAALPDPRRPQARPQAAGPHAP